MNFKQIQWCKKKGIIDNLKPDVAKQLNICAFYSIIESELITEFESLKIAPQRIRIKFRLPERKLTSATELYAVLN